MHGVPEFSAVLKDIPRRLRRRALRNALAAGARLVRDAARQNRRSGSGSPMTGNAISRYRRHGTVERAIAVRTSKRATRAGDVGVYVNVKPLPRAQQSARNPSDPYYWRFLEWGTRHSAALPFLTPAASRLSAALAKFISVIGPQIERLNRDPHDQL